MIAGLNLAHSLEVDQLEIYSDSQLVVRQIEDTYKAKSGRMILYLRKVRDLLKKFVLVQVRHVPRAENSRADTLAKLATASHQGLSSRSLVARFDEVIYHAQATQPKESDQLRLECHQGLSARSPVARFDEVIYPAQATQPKESDQLRLERHQGLSTSTPVARFDEVIYPAQATRPKESYQLRLERHQGLSTRSSVARFDEVLYPAQATQPKE